jgi:hypothetical protein
LTATAIYNTTEPYRKTGDKERNKDKEIDDTRKTRKDKESEKSKMNKNTI